MAKIVPTKTLYVVLVLSLLANLACLIYGGRRLWLKASHRPSPPPPKHAYYLDRDKLFEAVPADSGAVVFLGNSLTQYFELAEFFPGVPVKNRGIHGDRLEKVLQRLATVMNLKPQKIFIELGVNDIEQKVPIDTLLSLYARLLDTLQITCPFAEIFVQNILPVADTSAYLPASYCSPEMNRNIVAVNERLRNLAREKKFAFIDLHEKFLLNGQLNPAYSVDGVHLSGEGYALWAKTLLPSVMAGSGSRE